LQVQLYDSGQLAAMLDSAQAVLNGVADMAHSPACYQPDLWPINALWGFPCLWKDCAQSVRLSDALYDKYLEPEFEATGFREIGFYGVQPYQLYVSNKPVYKMEDLKGLRIRSYSETYQKLWAAAGAIPISVTFAETFENMQKGILDATPGYASAIQSQKVYEIGDPGYFIYMQGGGLPGCGSPMVMNLNFYNKLPSDLQKVVDDVAYQIYNTEKSGSMNETDAKAEQFLRDYGNEVIKWDPAETARLTETLAVPIWEEWAAKMDALGKPGTEILNFIKQWIAEDNAKTT